MVKSTSPVPSSQEASGRPEEGPRQADSPPADLHQPALYVNRETSWLAFNARVLSEAASSYWPLLERLKFLAIHASNLDEFFMIRVSGLHEQLEAAALVEMSPDGLSPREQLTRIGLIIRRQLATAHALLSKELLPALAEHGIHVRDWPSLDPGTMQLARQYFRRSVFPVITPLAVDPGHPFPFLSNLSLSLAIEARDPDSRERRFARVKVPESLPRFIPLDDLDPSTARPHWKEFLPLEQLIGANLDDLFPGMEILGCHPFRVTRDMDMDILEEEAHDLLSIVNRQIRRRRFGACVRLEVDVRIPDAVRGFLREKLEIDEEDVYESTGPLGSRSLMSIATLNRPELRDTPVVPRIPVILADEADVFAAIRRQDILLHHPYDSFSSVLGFLRLAAADPEVVAIKMTLYRAGAHAEAVRSLIHAAENGKEVAVSIEIKARFDEETNIAWAQALERAGAHVFFGHAVLKTHAKVALVVRREADELRRYVHLSTGNYNTSTARLYTDLGLLTADADLGEDVSELFNSLSGFSKKPRHRKLAVAPTALADALLAKIDGQAALARAGKPARIFAKMNALVDAEVVRALYRASMAGVPIDLCVRGVCCLRPGVPSVSENIRVSSIIGRFLEHERVFVFGTPGEEEFFLSSADWMPRNLHRRVEVLFPIEAEVLRQQIRDEVIGPALADNSRAYDMKEDGQYVQRTNRNDAPAINAQGEVLDRIHRRGSLSVAKP